jgi:hypothetical protein
MPQQQLELERPAEVVRISDYERRSHEPDAQAPRNPAECDVIILSPRRRFRFYNE